MFSVRRTYIIMGPILRQTSMSLRQPIRHAANQSRSANSSKGISRTKRLSMFEKLKASALRPASDKPFVVGSATVAGLSALGLGTLCYYGYGMSKHISIMDKSLLWPDYVKDRVNATYMYFGGSLALTAASAYGMFNVPALRRVLCSGSLWVFGGTLLAMIGSGIAVRSIPYDSSSMGVKHVAWAAHTGTMGLAILPLLALGGPLLMRAAVYTGGIVGGLSALAMTAPSEKFLNSYGVLGMGLGGVFIASIGTFFLPPWTAAGSVLYSVAMYGGLAVFGGLMLADTQKVIKRAEMHAYPDQLARLPYDPINSCIGIYLDTLNIFMRIAILLSGQKRRK